MELKYYILRSSIIAALLFAIPGYSQDDRLFDEETALKITITTDLSELLSNRNKENDYQEATIAAMRNDKEDIVFPVGVKTRGNFRRDSSNCDFPPIRLNFKKKLIENTFFEGNEKIKIVTHCKNNVPEFSQFIAREYVTYKIYNLITPISFKVRYAIIDYIDSEGNIETLTREAFLIEDIDNLANRNGMQEYDGSITINELNHLNAVSLCLFQYMIGNTDWIVDLAKNLKLVTDQSDFYAIPYDFDYTALVGTDYSLGGNESFLTSPTRTYKGKCYPMEEIRISADKLLNVKKDINKTIRKSDFLDYTSKQHMQNYLTEFFHTIKSDRRIKETILSECDYEQN